MICARAGAVPPAGGTIAVATFKEGAAPVRARAPAKGNWVSPSTGAAPATVIAPTDGAIAVTLLRVGAAPV